MQWGMNESLGPINPIVMGNMSDNISDDIMKQCKTIINRIEQQTMKLLTKHKSYIIEIGTSLLENETILYDKIQTIIPKELENSEIII
jgi:cell division protease FtsH